MNTALVGLREDSLPLQHEVIADGDWDYSNADTQYLTHNIHRYSGKFIPQIAARAIRLLTHPGELVVDPYCGSGTTLLEAALAQRRCIGFDLNPLAVLISNVKITKLKGNALSEGRAVLARVVAQLQERDQRGLLFEADTELRVSGGHSDSRLADPWFSKWFGDIQLREIVILSQAIDQLGDAGVADLARVALSDILRRCSRAHSGYPNVMFDKNAGPRAQPSGIFMSVFDRVASLVEGLSRISGSWSEVRAREGDATALPLEDSSVDAIVSHPPYIGSIPYAEYGLLSLKWLGVDPKALDRKLTGGQRQGTTVVERFEVSYRGMLSECNRVLRAGRVMFLLVGNPIVKGRVIDLREMTIRLGRTVGFELAAAAKRNGINRRANKMGQESLVFLRKPL